MRTLSPRERQLVSALSVITEDRRIAVRDAREHGGKFYPKWGCPPQWKSKEYPHLIYSELGYLNADGLSARRLLLECWAEIEAAGRDPLLDKLEQMAPYVDANWNNQSTYAPSEIMILRYFIEVSDIERPERGIAMKKEALRWVDEARSRWLAGFYANPFGPRMARPAQAAGNAS